MSYEKEEDERSEINRDRVSGEGVQEMHRMATTNYSLFLHPLTAKAVPIDFATLIFLLLVRHSTNKFVLCSYFVRRFPYKQGESAIQTFSRP